MTEPIYFRAPEEWRAWLAENHGEETELWVGYFKKATGEATITWPESVDQALCFGWIDGIRKRVDDRRYKIRFTPRKKNSIWSKVNLERMPQLIEEGLVKQAGMAAYDQRTVERSKVYAYERESAKLSPEFEKRLRKKRKAWTFYEELSPYNKKACTHWVMSAKREETRERRFAILLDSCSQGMLIPQFRRK